MKYAYYPGCSLSSTGIEYDMSTREIAKVLGIELWEIPEWNCCGASSAHLTDHLLALALPARNLAIAEEAGLDVAIPCAACYARSKATEVAVNESEEMKKTIQEVIERKYEGKSKARALLEIIGESVQGDHIKGRIHILLTGLKAACYYGCLLVRPASTAFDDPEDPQSMDQLLHLFGAETVDWSYKTECCGASHETSAKPEIGISILQKIFIAAQNAGANCLVTACPLCMNNLDMRQIEVEKYFSTKYNLPVFYFTELVGLALGIEPSKLGLNKHFVDAMPLVQEVLNRKGGEQA